MKRAVALVGILIVLIAGMYAVRAITAPDPVVLSARPQYDLAELGRLIGVFEERTAASPGAADLALLGNLYLRRSEVNRDLSDLENARDNLALAAELRPDLSVLTDLAQASLGLHDFQTASRLATDIVAVEPEAPRALAIGVDANLALGEWDQAEAGLALLARYLPDDPAVTVREAQMRFLAGDGAGAVSAALASSSMAEAANLSTREQAFYRMVAGRLLFETGDYSRSQEILLVAADLDPVSPGVLFELGRVSTALGDLAAAAVYLEGAAALVPEPTTLAWLGDVYLAMGDVTRSDLQYDTIGAIAALDQRAYNRAIAAAWAARGLEIEPALRLAEAEISARADPSTQAVYALALARAGEVDQAFGLVSEAVGAADARTWFHAGLIAALAGEDAAAIDYLTTALRLNPRFHPLEADEASRLLAQLDK